MSHPVEELRRSMHTVMGELGMTSTEQPTSSQPSNLVELSDQKQQEQIAHRAYELYLERGEYSDPVQNWLDAEKEILDSSAKDSTRQARIATTS